MTSVQFSPGDLVRARGREWIVLTGSDAEVLRVRPLSGSEADQTRLHLRLERTPVVGATFPPPAADQVASHGTASLLRDALLLSLRRGAGPFRSAGQIAVEPRAYQLVPLLMALKLDVVRLLVADDVGIGKTIEAALIVRELVDRGDIDRFTVLCPPHLVDQWTHELEARVNLRAVAVTAQNASRLEDALPPGTSVFHAHRYTVVSLDYIKNDNRRGRFLDACPDFVIVDEAHTCAGTGRGQQQRYHLLRELADRREREIVLLTATPHSGDEGAFYRLLGILDRDFEAMADAQGEAHRLLRERLSRHLVQRRRPDIAEWKEGELFARRHTKDLTYTLTGAWDRFFDDVLAYCAGVVRASSSDDRMSFWGTLAIMRCVASSPAAALVCLRTRAGVETEPETMEARVFDGVDEDLSADDVEPPTIDPDPALDALIAQAEALLAKGADPKLDVLAAHLGELLREGFNPVVFCRYIATARYVARELSTRLGGVTVRDVTGALTPDERRERVASFSDLEGSHVLVCTDCLSEGINLQADFDAVVHYDLSWNPTRHEQREGRVDRFGQKKKVVRATLLYGENNPVDSAVLQVILRKADKIRTDLGVPVPLPDEGHTLTRALLRAVLLRARNPRQRSFDFADTPEAKALDKPWVDAAERAKRNHTIFAQRRIKPEEVLVEWQKAVAAVGGHEEVTRFVRAALSRLGAGLEARPRGGYKAPLAMLPEDLRERLDMEGLHGTPLVDFEQPPATRCQLVHRSHPLVSVLAEALLERTLAAEADVSIGDLGVLGRAGAWISPAVTRQTTVVILRLRHQLTVQREGTVTQLLVEEAGALAWAGAANPDEFEGDAALALLAPTPVGDLAPVVRARRVAQAIAALAGRRPQLDAYAERRAQQLRADHRGVREASEARGQNPVRALLPVDVIGCYLLLPPLDEAP